MHLKKCYYVYIMTNRSKTLYAGITGRIKQRVFQHITGVFEGFTSRYKIDRLVYVEKFRRAQDAIAREKQLKGWTRIKKIQLIVSVNPTWKKPGGRLVYERERKCIDPSTARSRLLALRSG